MEIGGSRRYVSGADKLLDRVRKAYDAGSLHRMLRIRRELGKSGDTESMVMIGSAFAYGKDFPQDEDQAGQWYRLAAENGSPDGWYYYGRILDKKQAADEEGLDAAACYLKASVDGCRPAMFVLACIYHTGQGAAENPREALRWRDKAALREYEIHELVEDTYLAGSPAMIRRIREAFPFVGDVVGATMIGDAISSEIIRGQDHEEALTWYRTAARMAVPSEQCLIARQLEEGSGVTADLEEAVRCYQLAAENGNTESMRLLGILGEEEDYPEGKRAPVRTHEEIFRRAGDALARGEKKNAARIAMGMALQGMPAAQNMLGDLYEEGWPGQTKDFAKALEWYRLAAAKGYAPACYSLGWYYDRGRVVSEDPVIAFRWYHKAALAGDARAANHLAIAYDEGRGVRADQAEAFAWYRTSAAGGNAAAMYNLAICFRDGDGTGRDLAQALLWARSAMSAGSKKAPSLLASIVQRIEEEAEAGHPEAALSLGRIYEKGLETEPDEEESLRWYRLAADHGEPVSLNVLGQYARTRGEKAEAFSLFERAAAAGNGDAMYNLALCYAGAGKAEQDLYQARDWAEKASRSGSDAAHSLLVDLRQQIAAREREKEEIAAALCADADAAAGEGRHAQAVRLWTRAAEAGSREALGRLTHFYLGDPADLQEAARWGRQAWDAGIDLSGELFAGSARSLNVDETRFWAGRAAGDPKEEKALLDDAAKAAYEEALTLQLAKRASAAFEKFRFAALLGHAKAQYHTGRLLRVGMGTSRDADAALDWLQKAYDAGVDDSYELFAMAMERGDYEEALLWVNRYEERHADTNPRKTLLEEADRIYEEGLAELGRQKEKAALASFTRAAGLGHVPACRSTGQMYLYGEGTEKNPEKAAEYFLRAGDAGDREAKAGYVNLFYEEGVQGLDAGRAFAWLQDVIAAAKPGETFSFGSYFFESVKDHSWRILWRVLEKTGNEVLAISEYGIDAVPWHTGAGPAAWKNCDLRGWLNKDFLQFAFSPEEASLLRQTLTETDDNPDYGTAGGPASEDRITLLSMEEAMHLFTPAGRVVTRHLVEEADDYDEAWTGAEPAAAEGKRAGDQEAGEGTDAVWYDPGGLGAMALVTPFAVSRGALREPETDGCTWWLRSPGRTCPEGGTGYAACVMAAGEIYSFGEPQDTVKALRPVIRIAIPGK